MKILILVLSCQKEPFIEMRKVQQETWDSVQVEGVDTVYYIGGGSGIHSFNQINPSSRELMLPCSDEYNLMHWKLKQALLVLNWQDYDLIFKTNSSSYIHKKLLVEFANKLPTEKVYCGVDAETFASGCGVFLSKDCIEILLKHYDDYPNPSEDGLTGSYLRQNGIWVTYGAQRVDICVSWNRHLIHQKCYHYRCKHDYDRNQDMIVMRELFKIHGECTNQD